MLREEFFCQFPDFDVISPKTAHVLHVDGSSMILFQLGQHGLEAGPVHRDAGYTVVGVGHDVGVPGVFCCFGKQLLLIADAVAFAF